MLADTHLNFHGSVFRCGGQQGDWGLVAGWGRVDDDGVWAHRCSGLAPPCAHFLMIPKR